MNSLKGTLFATSIICLLTMCFSSISYGTMYGGVDFPDGLKSFADVVASYSLGTGGVTEQFQNTSNALGAPNYGLGPFPEYVSLGEGGSITVRFTDNSLSGSGNSDLDLWIFEVGPAVENTLVEISTDGSTWHNVGMVLGATSGIDIDSFGFGKSNYFSYVRLTDDISENWGAGQTAGADIDAIGAISSAPPVKTPEPVTFLLLVLGLFGVAGVRRFKK